MADPAPQIVWQCPWWRVEEREFRGPDGIQRHWYTALRPNPNTVHTMAITPEGMVPLLHQWRVPLQAKVWELPAGIIDKEGESLAAAALRELVEETGWEADDVVELFSATVSSGLCNEIYNGFLALGLKQVGTGGGLEGEQIEVRLVQFAELQEFLLGRQAAGELVDSKILTHLYVAVARLAEISTAERLSGNIRHLKLISKLAEQPGWPGRLLNMMLASNA
jgi:ADP-ribose pyrophosphatase